MHLSVPRTDDPGLPCWLDGVFCLEKYNEGQEKGHRALVQGHPANSWLEPRNSAPNYSDVCRGFALFNQTSGICVPSCIFLEKCPLKQLSLLEEGKSEDPRA